MRTRPPYSIGITQILDWGPCWKRSRIMKLYHWFADQHDRPWADAHDIIGLPDKWISPGDKLWLLCRRELLTDDLLVNCSLQFASLVCRKHYRTWDDPLPLGLLREVTAWRAKQITFPMLMAWEEKAINQLWADPLQPEGAEDSRWYAFATAQASRREPDDAAQDTAQMACKDRLGKQALQVVLSQLEFKYRRGSGVAG